MAERLTALLGADTAARVTVSTFHASGAQLLRACLNRRLEGERIVARDCQREAGAVAGALARHRAQQACERRALAVPSQELPKRPPPPPRPKVDPAGALPGLGPAGPGGAPTPAAGEQGGGVRP